MANKLRQASNKTTADDFRINKPTHVEMEVPLLDLNAQYKTLRCLTYEKIL